MIALLLLLWIFCISFFARRKPRERFGYHCVSVRRGIGRPKPPWVRREVLRLKALTGAGCRQVADLFNRLYAVERSMTISKSFVADLVRTRRYEIEVLRREIKHRAPPPQPRNLVWGVDLTGKREARGVVHSILGILDHGSRRALALQTLERKSAWAILGRLFLAIDRFGKPRAVRSDNEAVFRSWGFRAVLACAGIRQQFTVPGCPWMNGRVERFFGTLKERLDQWTVVSGETLQKSLDEFRFWYNAVRPHQHLAGRTPLEAWNKLDPMAKAPKSVEWFSAWDGLLTGYYLRR